MFLQNNQRNKGLSIASNQFDDALAKVIVARQELDCCDPIQTSAEILKVFAVRLLIAAENLETACNRIPNSNLRELN